MRIRELSKNVFRLIVILTFTTAANMIFAFSVIGTDNSMTAMAGASFVDIWTEVFTPGRVPVEPRGVPNPEEIAAPVTITLRDSVTGNRVRGQITAVAVDSLSKSFLTDDAGRGTYRLSGGRNDLEIAAPGYYTLKTFFVVGQKDLNITVWLDPLELPGEMRPEFIESNLRVGSTLIHGHILDDESGKPIQNARIFLENDKIDAISDRNGYFRMYVLTPTVDPAGDLPGSDNLVVETVGRVIYRRNNILLPDGAVHFILDVDRGTPTETDATHKLRLTAGELKSIQAEAPFVPEFETQTAQPEDMAVPASIRVGSNCLSGRTSCTVFTVYTLDTYVRFGLDDEWIASWNANSLKAGAIAFRSYGVYHIFNPLTVNYDICNTTSCQVMDSADSATSTNNATLQTTGSVVVNAARTGPFFSEYSAENNVAPGCGDGFTGRPEHNWPCLSDPVDAGQAFFGHGRGMCQWGSQRWSINQGKDFVWIVNHYYNGNGNPSGLRTGVLQLSPDTLLPPPTLAAPGVTTAPGTMITSLTPTFEWEAVNGADGYSLYVSRYNGSTYDLIFNSETVVGSPLAGTSYTMPPGFLQANGQYRWNMSSHTSPGYGTPNTFRNYFSISPVVSVSGRVTTPTGLGLRSATVALTDSQGVRQTAVTSSFGFYSFGNVRNGETYTAGVSSKRYRFATRNVVVNDNLTSIDFVGLE